MIHTELELVTFTIFIVVLFGNNVITMTQNLLYNFLLDLFLYPLQRTITPESICVYVLKVLES